MPRDGDAPGKGKQGGKNETPFRTSNAARTLKWKVRRGFTDQTAWEFMRDIRFRDNGGEPYCPACGSMKFYTIATRPRWGSCAEKECRKQYSVTSGTIFHSRKFEFDRLLELVFPLRGVGEGHLSL
jgi:hypothetical protein